MQRIRPLKDPAYLPAFQSEFAQYGEGQTLAQSLDSSIGVSSHAPRILLLYGSLRPRAFSRLAVEEAARLLQFFGADTKFLTPRTCLCPTRPAATNTPLCKSCARSACGLKARCGAAQSGMARLRG